MKTYCNFNSQPHKEADKLLCENILVPLIFQLTASQGGWHYELRGTGNAETISTHSLTRRLTPIYTRSFAMTVFQLTASQGGWRYDHPECLWYNRHFNSQPHKEADYKNHSREGGWNISTHSLTRRLTKQEIEELHIKRFQLTASQGGWHSLITSYAVWFIFQLTASQGGWPSFSF